MTKELFLKGMDRLNLFFPQNALSVKQIELYYSQLSDYSNEIFKVTVDTIVSECEFMPTVARFKSEMDKQQNYSKIKGLTNNQSLLATESEQARKDREHIANGGDYVQVGELKLALTFE